MSRTQDHAVAIARLRDRAALERSLLAGQLRVASQQSHGAGAVAGSVFAVARSLLAARRGPLGALGLVGRLGLVPVALRLGVSALRSSAGRWALLAGVAGAAWWFWRAPRR